jgi:hypothetical protein
LVHLFETHPKYYEHFYNCTHHWNIETLLDNSIFELKKAFDPDKFKYWIEELKPNCYIIPDFLEDAELTVEQCAEWLGTQGSAGHASTCRKIGVVQGKTFQELVDCYKFMDENVDQIAISFDYSYYKTTGIGRTPLELNATGRQRFITDLIREGVWNWRKPVHLLGCSRADEFKFYIDNNIYNIKSCDTSNPIIAGIEGIAYDGDFGLKTKSKAILADSVDIQLTEDQIQLIRQNVNSFKHILQRY